jgi:hypothetical protein
MRWIRIFSSLLILIWLLGGCQKQPDYSIVPQIQLQNITFKNEFQSTGNPDTLIISLRFTDGDGDLGINPDETAIYTSPTDSIDLNDPFYFIYDSTQLSAPWYPVHQNDLPLATDFHYVNYATTRTYHTLQAFDTLSVLTCKHWQIRASPVDTLYIQSNPNQYNIFVYIFTKNPDGTYTYYDPDDPKNQAFGERCQPNFFNSTFPVLSTDLGKSSPLDGTLTYKYQSRAFYLAFHAKIIRVSICITDRALHKSNVVTSDDILIN